MKSAFHTEASQVNQQVVSQAHEFNVLCVLDSSLASVALLPSCVTQCWDMLGCGFWMLGSLGPSTFASEKVILDLLLLKVRHLCLCRETWEVSTTSKCKPESSVQVLKLLKFLWLRCIGKLEYRTIIQMLGPVTPPVSLQSSFINRDMDRWSEERSGWGSSRTVATHHQCHLCSALRRGEQCGHHCNYRTWPWARWALWAGKIAEWLRAPAAGSCRGLGFLSQHTQAHTWHTLRHTYVYIK